MRQDQIPYGVKDFKSIRLEELYFVDKSAFIEKLEARAKFLFFVRPRRFGKSLFCEMLRCYYDVAEKPNFEKLFGGLYAGEHPTAGVGKYFVLLLDFSRVNGFDGGTWADKFTAYMNIKLDGFVEDHAAVLTDGGCNIAELKAIGNAGGKYTAICDAAKRLGYGMYVIVDEYDNFTNDIASTQGKLPYKDVTHGTGFYRGWFKQFKATADRIFMTGVSPVTMDDLTSGFNIATNISLSPEFHAMVGFTTEETRQLFEDFRGTKNYVGDTEKHLSTVRKWYDSYCFCEEKVGVESLYNCDMALYYLGELVAHGKAPKNLIDGNIKSDWRKLSMILAAQRHAETFEGVLPLTEELADRDEVTFPLVDSFPIERMCEETNFKSLYYYYGIVTMGRLDFDETYFRVPNECVRRQIFAYMRDEYAKGENPVDLTEFTRLFRGFARDGEWRTFFAYLAEKYRVSGNARDGIEGEARVNGFIRAYLAMKNSYMVRPEFATVDGYVDYALFPDPNAGLATPHHSYVVELKYAGAKATDAVLAKNHADAIAQLAKYAADPNLPSLAAGTPVHFLCYEFKGRDLVRLDEITPEDLSAQSQPDDTAGGIRP